MIDGVFDHQDCHGGGGSITNGDTQWMTAGSGILHIETPPEWLVASGGLFHGVQLWVNLPARRRSGRPRATRTCAPAQVGAADLRRRRRAACGSSPATSAGTPAPARRTRRWRWCTRPLAPGRAARPAVAGRTSTRSSTCSPGPARSAWSAARCRRASSPCSVAATSSPLAAADAAGQPAPAAWRCWCSAAGRSASRSPGAGPFVMNTKAEVLQAFEDSRRAGWARSRCRYGDVGGMA